MIFLKHSTLNILQQISMMALLEIFSLSVYLDKNYVQHMIQKYLSYIKKNQHRKSVKITMKDKKLRN